MSSADVEIVEVALTKGDFGDNLTGILKNSADEAVSGPIDVSAACFDKSGAPISPQRGFADTATLADHAPSSFFFDLLYDPCCHFAIGASGVTYSHSLGATSP